MAKAQVLIIDDDKDYLALLNEALSDTFDVKCANSVKKAEFIVAGSNEVFDIALVDENIGDDKGSAWIKKHSTDKTAATSFVLYSGLATEDAIIGGLECGAADFLSKPISLISLINKLEKLIDYQHQIHDFEDAICSKDRVINISMAQASKYGSCMQLTSKLNQCFTLEKIRDDVFNFLYSMKLKGCISFSPINDVTQYYSSENGLCSPVEKSVMEILKVKPRLYRFGSRTIFNHPQVSILILNLEDGTVDTDIYIDAFASVIECIGARMEFISYKDSLESVQENIEKAVTKTKEVINVSKSLQQDIMNEIVQNMGASFHVLDMNTEQEDYLTEMVHSALKKHSQNDTNFFEITDLLDETLKNVNELKSLNEVDSTTEIIEEEDELF